MQIADYQGKKTPNANGSSTTNEEKEICWKTAHL